MLDKQKQDLYSKFKNSIYGTITPSNTAQPSVSDPLQDPDRILERARLFIHRVKDHHHNKIKTKQIDKFEQLYYKIHGYHHNLTRCTNVFDNINHNNGSLSGQPNVPSSISPRPSIPSITSNVPATPGPPHLPPPQCPTPQHKETPTVATPPTHIHVECHWTNGLSIFPAPPYPANNYPYYKKDQTMPLSPNTPHRSLHHSHRISSSQTTYPRGRRIQV